MNDDDVDDSGAVEALARLLDSNLEDVLSNAINALRVLCSGDVSDIRSAVGAAPGAIPALVEFLAVPSGKLLLLGQWRRGDVGGVEGQEAFAPSHPPIGKFSFCRKLWENLLPKILNFWLEIAYFRSIWARRQNRNFDHHA